MSGFINLATLIALIALIISVLIAIHQIIEMRLATYATAFNIVMGILQTDKRRNERKLVMEILSKKPMESWSLEDISAAENVCQSYDTAGIMIRNKMLPVNIIADSWGNSIRTTWKILAPFIEQRREKNNSTEYWDDFEWLAKQANKYHKPLR